jgi:hypothetical protein
MEEEGEGLTPEAHDIKDVTIDNDAEKATRDAARKKKRADSMVASGQYEWG